MRFLLSESFQQGLEALGFIADEAIFLTQIDVAGVSVGISRKKFE